MSAALIASALAFALGLWWASTGAILWLNRRPRASYRWSLAGASVVAALAVAALVLTRDAATPVGAFVAFTAAIAVWGWHELSFLTGFVTGSSTAPCPAGARGWRRFRLAAATLMHHEVALAVTAVAVAALTLGRSNPIGGWTFLMLFGARLSSKLNLFLGAPNFSAEFFPAHLRYLTTYLRKAPVSVLYPVSIAGLTFSAYAAARPALDPTAAPFAATGYALVFALAALAVLEHAFMALPLPDAALWRWAMPASERSASCVRIHADAVETLN
jgi:putative photosynthetic complex assembly protein 2